MKRLAVLLSFLISTITMFAISPIAVDSQDPGEIIDLGVPLMGTINDDNDMDTYGLGPLTPGVYNLSLYTFGDGSIRAELMRYRVGRPYNSIGRAYDNESVLLFIYKERELDEYRYMLRITQWSDFGESEYVCILNKNNLSMQLETGNTYDFSLEDSGIYWFEFDCTDESVGYRIIYSWDFGQEYEDIDFDLYDSHGYNIWSEYTYSPNQGEAEDAMLLTQGRYYLAIRWWADNMMDASIRIEPIEYDIIEPDYSNSFYLNINPQISTKQYLRLNVKEGIYYSIRLDVPISCDAGFEISQGCAYSAPIRFDAFSLGGDEYVDDLVFFGQNSVHTHLNTLGTDYINYAYVDENTQAVMYKDNSLLGVDFSRTLIELFCTEGQGTVNFTIEEGTQVPTLNPSESMELGVNNVDGPCFYLLKIPDLFPRRGYSINIYPSESLTENFQIYGQFYCDTEIDSNYLSYYRPYLDDYSRQLFENSLEEVYYMYYEDGLDFKYYHSADSICWLYFKVPEHYDGSYYPEMFGSINVSISRLPFYEMDVGDDIQLSSGYYVLDYYLGTGVYKVSLSGVAYSSYGYVHGFFNYSGYSAIRLYSPSETNFDSVNVSKQFYYMPSGGDYYLFISCHGDAPMNVCLTPFGANVTIFKEGDSTTPLTSTSSSTSTSSWNQLDGVLTVGITASVLGALVIGFGLGRFRIGNKADLHKP